MSMEVDAFSKRNRNDTTCSLRRRKKIFSLPLMVECSVTPRCKAVFCLRFSLGKKKNDGRGTTSLTAEEVERKEREKSAAGGGGGEDEAREVERDDDDDDTCQGLEVFL